MNPAILIAVIGLVEQVMIQGPKIINDMKQRGELSESDAQALRDRMNAAFATSAWKTDAELPG